MVSIILSTIIYNKIRTIYYSEGIFFKKEEGRREREETSSPQCICIPHPTHIDLKREAEHFESLVDVFRRERT